MNSFYLLMVATGAYIGPINEPACNMAAAVLRAEGVRCQQATTTYACEVPGKPGHVQICPAFGDLPFVTKRATTDSATTSTTGQCEAYGKTWPARGGVCYASDAPK